MALQGALHRQDSPYFCQFSSLSGLCFAGFRPVGHVFGCYITSVHHFWQDMAMICQALCTLVPGHRQPKTYALVKSVSMTFKADKRACYLNRFVQSFPFPLPWTSSTEHYSVCTPGSCLLSLQAAPASQIRSWQAELAAHDTCRTMVQVCTKMW